jgi:HD-like signal output (HDOD) protein
MKKHKILFVDDDPLILKGLNRSLDDYSEFWESEFALSGKEALGKLAETGFDAVITDMMMPSMDGLSLLQEVNRAYPNVLRFILSGNTSEAQSIKSAIVAHQMFSKPTEMDHLFTSVERACRLKDNLKDPNLVKIITSIKSLPSKPRLYNNLLSELQNQEPNLKVIADIISKDTAMTAKILQLVNSAFFGLADHISSPQRAITILGINTTKALVFSAQVFSEYEGHTDLPLSIDDLWKHSMLSSAIARQIAADLKLSSQEQEDAQVSGILHDIGKLLELKIPKTCQLLKLWKGRLSIPLEYESIGTSHAEMGAYLLGIWGLPSPIVEAVMYHHTPSRQIAANVNILTALHVANGLVNMCNFEQENIYQNYLDLEYVKRVVNPKYLESWTNLARNAINNAEVK